MSDVGAHKIIYCLGRKNGIAEALPLEREKQRREKENHIVMEQSLQMYCGWVSSRPQSTPAYLADASVEALSETIMVRIAEAFMEREPVSRQPMTEQSLPMFRLDDSVLT
jgi:hypothetical protein